MPRHPTDHAGLEILPFAECLRLLASVPVGRVGFLADGEMVILPVNHGVDGQDLVFRTARGTKLSAAEGKSLVAFEADDYDQETRSGWSVLVNGRAEAVDDAADVRRLSHLALRAWVLDAWATAEERPVWIRIRPASVSGRRVPWIR
jgi:uncharacterized protein